MARLSTTTLAASTTVVGPTLDSNRIERTTVGSSRPIERRSLKRASLSTPVSKPERTKGNVGVSVDGGTCGMSARGQQTRHERLPEDASGIMDVKVSMEEGMNGADEVSASHATWEEESDPASEETGQRELIRECGKGYAFASVVRLHLNERDGKIEVDLQVEGLEHDSKPMSVPTKSINHAPGGKQLQKAREALWDQLVRTVGKLDKKIEKKKEELVVSQKMRENTGVQLYTQQGRVKTLQQKCADLSARIKKLTENEEQDQRWISNLKSDCMGSQEVLHQEIEALKESRGELQLLEAGIFQMDNERKAVKEQLETAKQSARAVGKVVSSLESQQVDFKYFMERKVCKLVNIQEEIRAKQDTIEAQRLEIQIASNAMQELNCQINRVLCQRKQMADQWRATMIATEIQSKDLQQARHELQHAVDECRRVRSEATGLKNALMAADSDKIQLDKALEKEKGKLSECNQQLEVLNSRLRTLASDISRAQKQKAATSLETKQLLRHKDCMSTALKEKESQLSKSKRHLDELNARDLAFAEEHEVCRTAGWLAAKRIYAVVAQTERLQDEIAHCERETELVVARKYSFMSDVERAKQERKVTCAQAEDKGHTFDSLTKELQAVMSRMERLTSALLVKEQSLQKLVSEKTEEDVGPMETTIASLKAEIADKEEQAMEMQSLWRKRQSSLLSIEEEMNRTSDQVHHLNEETRKLTKQREELGTTLEELSRALQNKADKSAWNQDQLLKLTDAMQKAKEGKKQLDNDIKVLRLGMKSLFEEGSMNLQMMDTKLEDSQALLAGLKKRSVLEESNLIEMEREISIEKETQQALLPLLKRSANIEVLKEVRGIRNDLKSAQKLQAKLWTDLQRQISKRGTLTAAHQGTWKKGYAEKQALCLKKQEENLERSIGVTRRALHSANSTASSLDSERFKLRKSIEHAAGTLQRKSRRMEEVHVEIESLKRTKILLVARTLTLQHLHKSAAGRMDGSESTSWRSVPPQARSGAADAHTRVHSVQSSLLSFHASLPNPMEASWCDATLLLHYAVALCPAPPAI